MSLFLLRSARSRLAGNPTLAPVLLIAHLLAGGASRLGAAVYANVEWMPVEARQALGNDWAASAACFSQAPSVLLSLPLFSRPAAFRPVLLLEMFHQPRAAFRPYVSIAAARPLSPAPLAE